MKYQSDEYLRSKMADEVRNLEPDYPIARNRKERRQLMAETLKTLKHKGWGEWEHRFDAERRPPAGINFPAGFVDGWCNNIFAVQRYETNGWDRILIRRHDSGRVVWAEMQRIKNELFGEDRIAIEVLPRQSDVVDSANMYWFFLCPKSHEAILDRITCNQGAGPCA